MRLVVGATGMLGSEIVRRLRERGKKVRALVRPTSQAGRLEALRRVGAEMVEGDLKQPVSLAASCEGIDSIITTASSTISRQPSDSIQTVDLEGYLALIEAARQAGVRRFVYTSIPARVHFESPLTRAKSEVARRLAASGMAYTVLAANYFMEVWLSPMLGFDYENARATIYGSGEQRTAFVSYKDVAEIAVRSLDVEEGRNRTLTVGGPRNVTPLEVVQIFENTSGRKFTVEHVSEESLLQKRSNASNPLEETFAALMLDFARGWPMDMQETLSILPIQLTSIEDYAKSAAKGVTAHA